MCDASTTTTYYDVHLFTLMLYTERNGVRNNTKCVVSVVLHVALGNYTKKCRAFVPTDSFVVDEANSNW